MTTSPNLSPLNELKALRSRFHAQHHLDQLDAERMDEIIEQLTELDQRTDRDNRVPTAKWYTTPAASAFELAHKIAGWLTGEGLSDGDAQTIAGMIEVYVQSRLSALSECR